MRKISLNALRFLCFLLLTFSGKTALAQPSISAVYKQPGVVINSNCNGYLEYLPPGYSTSNTQGYPLLIFFNGLGTQGPGTSASLDLFETGGGTPPEQIDWGWWQPTATVNGQTFSFIVITPQFIRDFCCQPMPSAQEVDDVINYMIQHYNVDESRIYLTGVSAGAYVPFEYCAAGSQYANRIAAIAPFATTSWGSQAKADVLRNSNVAVWAFHNIGDINPPSIFTSNWNTLLNTPSPAPTQAKATLFPVYNSHLCWWDTYNRQYTEGGMNLYEWMLQFSKPSNAPLPVQYSLFNANCTGSAVQLTWKTAAEVNTSRFAVEKSNDGRAWKEIASVSASGQSNTEKTYSYRDNTNNGNIYRIVAHDIDGKKTYSSVIKAECKGATKFSLYPNPIINNGVIDITSTAAAKVKLTVLDMKGAVAWQQEQTILAGTSQLPVSFSNLPKGTYTLNALWQNESKSVKLIKQ